MEGKSRVLPGRRRRTNRAAFLAYSLLFGLLFVMLAGLLLPGRSGAFRADTAARSFLDAFFDSSDGPAGSAEWDDLPRLRSSADRNNNGISDTEDIIAGARAYVQKRPLYRSAYYRGGYPPEGEGVCTDVIWAALQHAGYDLKQAMAADIRANRGLYKRVGTPDANIDFRRVPNQIVYFKRHGKTLGTTIKPGDRENLTLWQPGDIVTFANPDHVAILSDKRNREGVPFLLHNQGPWAEEGDDFMYWYERGITGHFRFPAE